MRAYRTVLLTTVTCAAGLVLPAVAAADSGVAPAVDYGGGCVVDPGGRGATIDSLRARCTLEQQNTIFSAADAGSVPMGMKNGWVTTPAYVQGAAPAVWIGKTFFPGGVVNRLTPAGFAGFPADVYSAPAITDGAPTWALNYAPSPIPQIYDEIREIVPGLWFGYSWRRDTAPPTLMLTFALS